MCVESPLHFSEGFVLAKNRSNLCGSKDVRQAYSFSSVHLHSRLKYNPTSQNSHTYKCNCSARPVDSCLSSTCIVCPTVHLSGRCVSEFSVVKWILCSTFVIQYYKPAFAFSWQSKFVPSARTLWMCDWLTAGGTELSGLPARPDGMLLGSAATRPTLCKPAGVYRQCCWVWTTLGCRLPARTTAPIGSCLSCYWHGRLVISWRGTETKLKLACIDRLLMTERLLWLKRGVL